MKIGKRLRGEVFMRSQHLSRGAIDSENRTVRFTFSSELPVDRWFGKEILDHSAGSIRTERLEGGAPLLLDHDGREVIGVIEDFEIDEKARKASVVARFSRNAKADEVWTDVIDGIRKNVSVGYMVHDEDPEVEEDDGVKSYRFRDWEPYEVSFVGVPADHKVGVGRSKDNDDRRHDDMKKCIGCKQERDVNGDGLCDDCVRKLTGASHDTPPAPDPARQVSVDTAKIEADARRSAGEAEKERIREISAIGERFHMQEDALKAIEANTPLDEFRKEALEKVSRASRPGMLTSDDLGMSDSERQEYSLCRAILHMVGEKDFANCFEREVHDDLSKKFAPRSKGIMVPSDLVVPRSFKRELMLRTTMVGSTDNIGGYLVASEHRADLFLDYLRAKTILGMMGSQIMEGLVANIEWPSQASDPTFYWLATETGALTESNLTFGQNTMSPKPVSCKQSYSRQLLRQSNPSIENVVRNAFLNAFAVEVDRIGINGNSSSNEPTGILNTSGIGAVAMGTDGGALTWGGVVDLETEVAIDNADVGSLGYITNPQVRGAGKQTLKSANVAGYIWPERMMADQPEMLNGFKAGVTTNVPSTLTKGASSGVCSAMIYGNFLDALYGFWGAMEIEEDRITNADSGGGIVLRLFHFLDFLANRAESFAAIKDITTS